MGARQFSATLLLALLWPNAPAQPLRLQHFTPLTLKPVGAQVKLDSSWFYGYQNYAAANGSIVVRLPNAIEVIDGSSLEVTQRYAFEHRGTCAVDFDGSTVVALTGCLTASSKHFTIWRLTPRPGARSRSRISTHSPGPSASRSVTANGSSRVPETSSMPSTFARGARHLIGLAGHSRKGLAATARHPGSERTTLR
jgi:hypothetical protein